MKTLLLLASLQLVSIALHAEDCIVSTTTSALESDKSLLSKEVIDEKTGKYIAIYKNGDLLLASFAPCDLGLHAHFYSRELIPATAQVNRLNMFIDLVQGKGEASNKLKSYVKADALPATGQPIILTVSGMEDEPVPGESHQFVFKTDESPLYRSAIHYNWNPPQH